MFLARHPVNPLAVIGPELTNRGPQTPDAHSLGALPSAVLTPGSRMASALSGESVRSLPWLALSSSFPQIQSLVPIAIQSHPPISWNFHSSLYSHSLFSPISISPSLRFVHSFSVRSSVRSSVRNSVRRNKLSIHSNHEKQEKHRPKTVITSTYGITRPSGDSNYMHTRSGP